MVIQSKERTHAGSGGGADEKEGWKVGAGGECVCAATVSTVVPYAQRDSDIGAMGGSREWCKAENGRQEMF